MLVGFCNSIPKNDLIAFNSIFVTKSDQRDQDVLPDTWSSLHM